MHYLDQLCRGKSIDFGSLLPDGVYDIRLSTNGGMFRGMFVGFCVEGARFNVFPHYNSIVVPPDSRCFMKPASPNNEVARGANLGLELVGASGNK